MSRASKLKLAIVLIAAVGSVVFIRPEQPAFANAPAPGPESDAAAEPIADPVPPPPEPDAMARWRGASDPLEPVNRGLYKVNRGLQKVVFGPVLAVILVVLPKPVQRGLHNVIRNLGEPVTVVNDLLQLRVGKAVTATGRFLSNSTLGLLGLFDVATAEGLAYHASDFGQTLARYGVPTGPYVFVPVLGPSSLRDAGARIVNGAIDPLSAVRFHGDDAVGDGRTALSTLETQGQIYSQDGGADDPYVSTRTAYLQRRGLPAHTFEVEPGDLAGETERQATLASVSSSFFQPAQ